LQAICKIAKMAANLCMLSTENKHVLLFDSKSDLWYGSPHIGYSLFLNRFKRI